MTLLAQIKQRSIAERKAKSELASFFITLLAESARPGQDDGKRESTDDEVIKVLKRFLDGAIQIRDAAFKQGDHEKVKRCEVEISELHRLMPAKLSDEELKNLIALYITFAPNAKLGDVMTHLRQTYAGRYDGAKASAMAKELLV